MSKLTAIAGPMYSGKTEALIGLIKRPVIAGKRVLVVKSEKDERCEDAIITRALDPNKPGSFIVVEKWPAHIARNKREFDRLIREFEPHLLAIDEIQFFPNWLVGAVSGLLHTQREGELHIIVSGLDMDFMRRPFARMSTFMAMANKVIKLNAVCMLCKEKDAIYTQKKIVSTQILEADSGMDTRLYEARCCCCHTILHS